MLAILCKFIGVKTEIMYSESYFEPQPALIDMRNAFSPKKQSTLVHMEYKQVFDEKHGFIPNLSIIDLLFNEGKFSSELL